MEVDCRFVEFSVSCLHLPTGANVETAYEVSLLAAPQQDGNWVNVDTTEVVWSAQNPRFAHAFKLDVSCGDHLSYKLLICAMNSKAPSGKVSIGEAEVHSRSLLMSGTLDLRLTRNGNLIPDASMQLWIERFDRPFCNVSMQICCSNLFNKRSFLTKSSHTFLEISKLQLDGSLTLVHRTDVVKNSANPRWTTFSNSIWKLCGNQWDRQLYFCVYSWKKNSRHEAIGYFYTTLREMLYNDCEQELKEVTLMTQTTKNYKALGKLHFVSIRIDPVYSLQDYVHSGHEIKFTVAMDYSSNDQMTKPKKTTQQKTDCLQCIDALSYMMDEYKATIALDDSKRSSSKRDMYLSQYLQSEDDSDSGCTKKNEELVKRYNDELKSISYTNTTNATHALRATIEQAVVSTCKQTRAFHVLTVVTDRDITEDTEFVDMTVLASDLPISVVVIGTGSTTDFTTTKMLAKRSNISDSQGRSSQNIVSFLQLNQSAVEEKRESQKLCHQIESTVSSKFFEHMKLQAVSKQRESISSLSSSTSLLSFEYDIHHHDSCLPSPISL